MGRRRILRAISQAKPASRPELRLVQQRSAWLYSGPTQLNLELNLPQAGGRCAGWVIVPQAGSLCASLPLVLAVLHRAGFATLAVDLFGRNGARDGAAAFDTGALSSRLVAVTRWLAVQPEARGKRLAFLASGAAAGAAFAAAAQLGDSCSLAAVVSLNGRVDLASPQLGLVAVPSLMVVGRGDRLVLDANRAALRRLNPASRLVLAPSFRYLRYALRDPGQLDAMLAVEWLTRHVAGARETARTHGRSPVSLLDILPSHGRAAAAATVLALLASLAGPLQPAQAAGSVLFAGGVLSYTGDPGVSESLTVSGNKSGITLSSTSVITPYTGCTPITSKSVSCGSGLNPVNTKFINMGDGNDTVTLFLQDNFGTTVVDGGNNNDSLLIDDSANGYSDDTTLTGSVYFRSVLGGNQNYANFANVQVNAESGSNGITVFGTNGGTNTTLNAGSGADVVNLGIGVLDSFDGPLTVTGGSGTDKLVINDGVTGSSSTYKSGSVVRSGVAAITFQSANDFESASLLAGSGNDSIDFSGFGGPVSLDGGGGNDTLTGGNGNDVLNGNTGTDSLIATADTSFTLSGSASSSTLYSGNIGNDTLLGIDAASITGGNSGNTLNAFNWTGSPVTLRGGGGDDVIYGSSQNDVLDGGTGTGDFVVGIGNGNFTVSDSQMVGPAGVGTDNLSNFEFVQINLSGGANSIVDASQFTQHTYLFGNTGNDIFYPGTGAYHIVDGGGGTNELRDSLASASSNWVLTSSLLNGGSHGSVSLTNIQNANLTGSAGNDRIDTSGFSAGNVTVDAGFGNDTLVVGGGNFTGDNYNGNTGTDSLIASGDTNFQLGDSFLFSPATGDDNLAGIDAASLTGGAGNNTIDASGFSGPTTLDGLAGNDTLLGGSNNDILIGDQGNDSLTGNGGTDTVVESGGSFTLTSTSLTGFAGNDTLAGDIEQASLTGSSGNDSLDASGFTVGPVTLDGASGNNTLAGGTGSDSLNGGSGGGTNWVMLSATSDPGGDSFSLTNSNLTVTGRGSDALANIQRASLTGGGGNDTLDASSFSGQVTLSGGAGDDFLRGSKGNDSLDGAGGNDTLGATGDTNMTLTATSLVGGAGIVGTDLFSGIEFASLVGGAGANVLDASAFTGPVTLMGLAGNDTLSGGPQSDSLDGGANTDLASYNVGNINITLTGNSIQGQGNDTLTSIESFFIQGGPGNNIFDASSFNGAVALSGGGGNDLLIGSGFADTLLGQAGNDTLIGNGGADSLDGGTETDAIAATGDQNYTLTGSLLTGSASGNSTLVGIEQAVITGGVSSNLFNVTAFTGTVTLSGDAGDDTFSLGSGGGSVDGGLGAGDLVNMLANGTLTLTDTTLTGNGSYALSNIERFSLTGGIGADNFNASGYSGNVTLSGMAGNDTLVGGSGSDCILGGNNDDSLSGGPGANTIDGGPGANDRWLESGDFNITLVPLGLLGEQDDSVTNVEIASITGGSGDNTFNLGGFSGQATVDGGAGNDLLSGGNGSDSLFGNTGNDTLVGNAANDTLDGGDGTDQLYASGDLNFTLSDARLDGTGPGGTGTDTLIAIEEAHIVGGPGHNLIDATHFGASQIAGQVTLEGLAGNDTLIGGEKNDSLDGGNGNDCLMGGNGNDTLTGGDTDTTPGAAVNDTLLGGAGDDLLDGVYGNDYLDGGSGNDQLIGASGNDVMIGGDGNDLLSAAFDTTPGTGAPGNDTLSGGLGNDTIEGGPGVDLLLETGDVNFLIQGGSLLGGLGTDVLTDIEQVSLTGGDSANLFDVSAFTGTATLIGGLGPDTFTGTANNDSIDGGGGSDRLVETGGDFVLSDLQLIGRGTDALTSIEEASLIGNASANTLNASGFTGSPTLDGGGGDDTLYGGSGNDSIVGGTGNNLLIETAAVTTSVQFTLTNASLLGYGTDVLSNTFRVSLTGGSAGDMFDVSAFTGTATLVGGLGNDTFQGAHGGVSMDGGGNNDLVRESGDVNMLLTSTNLTRTDTLSATVSADALSGVELASLTGGASANVLDASAFGGSVTLDAGAGDDVLIGSAFSDSLLGGPGFDTLTGGQGNDTLDGGDDSDLLVEQAAGATPINLTLTNDLLTGLGSDVLLNIEAASLTGGSGNDTLIASGYSFPTTLLGNGGDDSLVGGSAGDSLDGGDGKDTLTGNVGSDTIFGGGGAPATDLLVESANTNLILTNFNLIGLETDFLNGIEAASLTGGAGNNIIDASAFTAGSVTLDGSGGNDSLVGTINADSLRGGPGTDTLRGNGGNDTLDAGSGNVDRLTANGDNNFTLLNSSLTVSSSSNILFTLTLTGFEEASITGGLGDNIINASGFTGTVTLNGGSGKDVLVGGPQNDSLVGGSGSDTLTGGPGNDFISGGGGDLDRLIETADTNFVLNNTLLAGLGSDILDSIEEASLTGGVSANQIDTTAFSGNVTLDGGPGNDTLTSAVGNDSLVGGGGADLLNAGAGNNTLHGGPGNDSLTAGAGNDSLDGGPDDDVLSGGGGSDTIVGGLGTDRIMAAGDVDFTLTDNSLAGNGSATLSGLELASLTGGAGNNSFDLQGWTGSATIDGGPGVDALSIAGTAGNDTPTITGSQVAFGLATTQFVNLEHLAVFGGDGDDVFAIPSLAAAGQTDGPGLVSALTELTLSGGAGNDTFSLAPLDGIALTVDGGPQPDGGGDALTFNAGGLYAANKQGEIEVDGHPSVAYSNIEIINILNHAYKLFLSFLSR